MQCLDAPVAWRMAGKAVAREGRAELSHRGSALLWLGSLIALATFTTGAASAELPAAAQFRKNIRPTLEKFCADCHFDGMNKGGVAFDEFKSDAELLAKKDLWQAVLKNTRAGLMP